MAATACMHVVPSPASLKQLSSSSTNKSSRASLFTITCESSSPKPTRRVALTSVLLCGAAASVPAAVAYERPFYVPMMEGPDIPGFKTMDTGVMLQDIVEGSGAIASENDSVEFNYVCRRANGYFVYSTVDQFTGESSPITLPLSGGKMIAGLKSILVGMKPGGKRRAVVPPYAGYISTDLEPQPPEWDESRLRSIYEGKA
ncbi:hypothetical protein GOP47_0020868 [Adiantum capillus-veneris]|uniref:peptidylprolyl isomerase n=1 Tax=Adiantum capillus-veneris TaxID=13818 RepID=A0A9D4UA02_ADICA|nr:hypothetical protein GOP47_0020868 [Adiantum capillus-veneris]